MQRFFYARSLCFWPLAALGLFSTQAVAADFVVTFESMPDRIRQESPELAAARLRVDEAKARSLQAGRRSNPDLEMGFGGSDGFSSWTTELGVSQSFPVTSRLGIEKDVSLLAIRAAEAEIREVERALVAAARDALVDILADRQQRELRQEQVELSDQLARFVTKYAERGELSRNDAGQAKLEAVRLASEARQLRAHEAAAIGKLKLLLGMLPSDGANIVGELPVASLPAEDFDLRQRPTLQKARFEVEAAELGVDLERARRFEDFEAGIMAGIERSEDVPIGYESEFNVGLQLKVPFPLWNKNEGNIQAAEARAARKREEVLALSFHIEHEAEIARLEMMEWSTMLREITDEILPLAIKQAAETESAYRQGLGDLQAVLRAREQQLELGASRIDALRNFHHARVRFDAAVANQ